VCGLGVDSSTKTTQEIITMKDKKPLFPYFLAVWVLISCIPITVQALHKANKYDQMSLITDTETNTQGVKQQCLNKY